MSSFMAWDKSKTIHLPVKRDKGCLTIYISSLWFYRGGGNWICMNWLGSMRRGRDKKGGETESEQLKSLHGKLKTMEKGSQGCYGSRSENCRIVKRLIEKEWK